MKTTTSRRVSEQGVEPKRVDLRLGFPYGRAQAALPVATPPPSASFGLSPMANAFEARVECRRPERGLFLVIGHRGSPLNAVRSVGGQVVAQLVGGLRLLAVLPVAAASAVQRHPDVALAGPVNVDAARFAHFTKLAGLDGPAKEKQ